jgi:DNA-binding transcriptional LysR family regulator
VFVHAEHPWAEREELRIEELENQPVILREPGSTTRRAFEKALTKAGVKISPVMEIGSREAVWLAVSRGLGIGVVSDEEFMWHPGLRKLTLKNADVYTTCSCSLFKGAEKFPHDSRFFRDRGRVTKSITH